MSKGFKRTELKCVQSILTCCVFQKAKFSLGTATFSRISFITSDAFVLLTVYFLIRIMPSL